jgi:hypothetical protein
METYNPKVSAIMESLPWFMAKTVISHKLLASNYINVDDEIYRGKMKAVQDFAKKIATAIPFPRHTNQIEGKEFLLGAFVLTREQMEFALNKAYMQGRLDSNDMIVNFPVDSGEKEA